MESIAPASVTIDPGQAILSEQTVGDVRRADLKLDSKWCSSGGQIEHGTSLPLSGETSEDGLRAAAQALARDVDMNMRKQGQDTWYELKFSKKTDNSTVGSMPVASLTITCGCSPKVRASNVPGAGAGDGASGKMTLWNVMAGGGPLESVTMDQRTMINVCITLNGPPFVRSVRGRFDTVSVGKGSV